ncbi:MAG: FtsX-like permease family protein [Actinoplanes sp.]
MISLVLAMVWARRGQAVTLALLAMFGVAAAVAGPAYLRAADRAVAAGQIRTAPPGERSVVLELSLADSRDSESPASVDPAALRVTPGLTELPGFGYVYAIQANTIGLDPNTAEPTRLLYRQDICAHVTVVAGRCLVGESDVVIGEQTGRQLGLRPGQSVTVRYATFDPTERIYLPNGRPKTLLVTGFYRVTDPGEAYWGSHPYFENTEPAFVTEATLRGMDLGGTLITVDGYAGPGALDVDRLPAVREGLDELRTVTDANSSSIVMRSGLPGLLTRIDAGRVTLHRVVPVLAVALVLLACLTIFIAVGYGTEGRRPELAVVALRGARAPQRWWLGTGENAVAILAGGLLGCLAGQLLVNAFTAVRFPGVGADPGLSSLRWAPVALAAVLLTALFAERRQLAAPVLELLRRAPAVRGQSRAVAFELAVLLLAAAATVQLAVSGGTLTGVGGFATALVLIAAALLAARLLMRGITAWSRRALARGRLGLALSGLHLSRRPGGARLLALLVAAVAVASYAASAVDVAAHGRQTQAALGVGADRVLTVDPVPAPQLLAAVRQADPDGRWAMAAVRLPDSDGSAPVLALDTTRLATVGAWPDGGPDRRDVARALRPAAAEPIRLTGAVLRFDITAGGFTAATAPEVGVMVASGAGQEELRLGTLRNGRHTYTQRSHACAGAGGCVLDAVHVFRRGIPVDIAGTVELHGLPTAAWRGNEGGRITDGPDGPSVAVNLLSEQTDGLYLQPVDTPATLPAATAGRLTTPTVPGVDGRTLPVARDIEMPALPATGLAGTLVDLEYADRYAVGAGVEAGTQVWLSDQAPADALDRLRTAGLAPGEDVRAADVKAALDNDGLALGLLFYALTGALAALLAGGALTLTAAVDRARRIEDLTALRAQGLPLSDLRRATLWTYPALAAVAALAGTLIGLGGWFLTGWALPAATTLPVSRWPSVLVLAGTAVVVLALLAGVAALAGRRTLRAITRG